MHCAAGKFKPHDVPPSGYLPDDLSKKTHRDVLSRLLRFQAATARPGNCRTRQGQSAPDQDGATGRQQETRLLGHRALNGRRRRSCEVAARSPERVAAARSERELLGLAGHGQQRQGAEDAGHVQTQTPKRASKRKKQASKQRKQANKQKRKHRENSVRVREDIGKTQNFLWELATPSCSLLCCPVQRHLQRCRKLIVWAALNVDVCLALLQAAA